jgi:hypothetical protein
MTGLAITLQGAALTALGSGALWWADESLLCVSDLHLGKSDRIARRGGTLLPPFETRETLARLDEALTITGARTVVCLGDSFDDLAAASSLDVSEVATLTRMMAGRHWVWIEGNHDPGPLDFGGTHLAELRKGPLAFRHIANPDARAEVSGHYHPKASLSMRGHGLSRPCFLVDDRRVILPAFGTYTGGLRSTNSVLTRLMGPKARAILLGRVPQAIPMPR